MRLRIARVSPAEVSSPCQVLVWATDNCRPARGVLCLPSLGVCLSPHTNGGSFFSSFFARVQVALISALLPGRSVIEKQPHLFPVSAFSFFLSSSTLPVFLSVYHIYSLSLPLSLLLPPSLSSHLNCVSVLFPMPRCIPLLPCHAAAAIVGAERLIHHNPIQLCSAQSTVDLFAVRTHCTQTCSL